jgi:hypothetical protein
LIVVSLAHFLELKVNSAGNICLCCISAARAKLEVTKPLVFGMNVATHARNRVDPSKLRVTAANVKVRIVATAMRPAAD